MLRTLDLFSGVGGITHALRGLATPVMYCEKDPDCHAVLEKLMRQGRIPRAPIHADISRLQARDVPGKVDMIVAGFPCIGFSTAGVREGLDQPGSRLFLQVMRLAKDLRPPFMFFENVAAILGNSDIKSIVRHICKLGYNMFWVVMAGYNVGSPQKRARWFCLAVRSDVRRYNIRPSESYTRFSWKTEPGTRMVPSATAEVTRRNRMLGNSVVPDCVRAAFLSLWTGCVVPVPKLLAGTAPLELRLPAPQGSGDKAFACVIGSKVQRINMPVGLLGRPKLNLVLVPGAFRSTKELDKLATSGVIQKPVALQLWATPRAGNGTYASNFLTNRCSRDLGTQLRFERRTPASQRKGVTNPEFVEWLMGFPQGWTK